MTTNTKLLVEICERLLAAVELRGRWTEAGSAQNVAGNALSPEQRATLAIAKSLWDGNVHVGFSVVWSELEADRVSLIGTLLVASAYGDEGRRALGLAFDPRRP